MSDGPNIGIAWSVVETPAHDLGLKYTTASLPGWDGREIVIGQVEQRYTGTGWPDRWTWRTVCRLGRDLLGEGTRGDMGDLQRRITEAWADRLRGAAPPTLVP